MIKNTLKSIKSLSVEVRGILASYAVYALAEQMMMVFMGIFIYTSTDSLAYMALYFFVYFTACVLGFSFWGLLMSKLQINMKWNHLRSFSAYIIGFIWLWFFSDQNWYLLVFAFFHGLGLGMFWLGHHCFEMLHTHDEDRDFYSAMLGATDHLTSIVGPALATIIFLLSEHFFENPLTLIFFVMPLIYIFVLPFLWNLPDYVPEVISNSEWKRLRTSKKLVSAKRFAFVESLGWGAWEIFAPLITIAALETYINVGLFDTVIGLFAIILVFIQGHIQNKTNRKKIFHISLIFLLVYYLGLLFWPYSPWVFILLGLYWVPVYAVYGTVFHVVSLKNIDQLRCHKGHFYAGLLYREWVIYLGRLTSLIGVGGVAYFSSNEYLVTVVGITWIIIEYLLLAWFVEGVLED